MGASDDDIEAFIQTHLSPSLPPKDEVELPRPDTNRGTLRIDRVIEDAGTELPETMREQMPENELLTA